MNPVMAAYLQKVKQLLERFEEAEVRQLLRDENSHTDTLELKDAKGLWAEELLGVLWAYRTMIRAPTNHSPFSFIYRTEAVIPVEISEESLHTSGYLGQINDHLLNQALDEAAEMREAFSIRLAKYQQIAAMHYKSAMLGSSDQIRKGLTKLSWLFNREHT
nr:uncharacterized protein LOC125419555 [Ziziphus jujuba var. spinosa]